MTDRNPGQWQDRLKALNACAEAVRWSQSQPSFREAWQSCERADWMLWLCGRMHGEPGWPTRKQIVFAACQCARTALKYLPPDEKRPLRRIEVTEAWTRGEATIVEVRKARYAAAHASYAAAHAYHASYAACADAAAAYAARTRALKEMAEIIRLHLTVPEEI